MRIKKFLAILLALCLLITALPTAIFATANEQVQGPFITYTLLFNGEKYNYDEKLIELNALTTLTVTDVKLYGEPVDDSQVQYQWSRLTETETQPYPIYIDIEGATSSSYTFNYDGARQYYCQINVGEEGTGLSFQLKEDTITAKGFSDHPIEYSEEFNEYVVSAGELGNEVTLSVTAESTYTGPDKQLSYRWEGFPIYTYRDFKYDESLYDYSDQTGNTITIKRQPGMDVFYCTVYDGYNYKTICFVIEPEKTVTTAPLVNNKTPKLYAGTLMYVAKPGEQVVLDFSSTSTKGDVEYIWYENSWEPNRLPEITGGTYTITKKAPTEDDIYGYELYECFVLDGNERIRYAVSLFCLDPDTFVAETTKLNPETPDITFTNEKEQLANNILSYHDLENMCWNDAEAEITMETNLIPALNSTEQEAVNSQLNNDNLAMCIDINLFKTITNDAGVSGGQVTETNNEINLSVAIPENLINQDPENVREYKVIRVHEGVAETLDCNFNPKNNTIDFNTDKFSTYAITYSDTPKHTHSLTFVNAKAPTNQEQGNNAYYSCECGKWFADAAAKTEITDKESVKIEKLIIPVENGTAKLEQNVVDTAVSIATQNKTDTAIIEIPSDASAAQIPTESLNNVKKAEDIKNLAVQTQNATVTFNQKAIESIVKQVGDNQSLTLKVDQIKTADLNEQQQKAVKNADVALVISAEMVAGNTVIKDFEGGSATVEIPFEITSGKAQDYTVAYIADDGTVELLKTEYINGKFVVELKHFSEYAIIKNATSTTPNTSDNSMYSAWISLLCAAGLGILGLIYLGKKKYCK